MKSFVKRVVAACAVLAVTLAVYFFLARPYQLHWGASPDEISRAMPGDELDRNPTFLATRAITINAAPEAIWPWLIQMGFNRAGFYGYDILEGIGNKRGMVSSDSVIPEFQHPSIGETEPISLVAATRFFALQPNKYLIWATPVESSGKINGGFTWALYPIDSGHTRLISRIRWTHHWTDPILLPLDALTEFTDYLALRKILPGLKARAEGRGTQSFLIQSLEFFYFLSAALLLSIALLLLLVMPLTVRRVILALIAGMLWIVTWYSELPIWLGAILECMYLMAYLDMKRVLSVTYQRLSHRVA